MRLLALALSGLALGCATFRDGDARAPSLAPAAGTPTQSIRLALTQRPGRYNGEEGEVFKSAAWESLVKVTREAYVTSNLFYEVTEHWEQAELRAEIEVSVSTDSSPSFAEILLVTGLGTLIPLEFSETFHMHTTFKDESGEILAETDGTGRLVKWVHLFAVFLAPGHGARDMEEALFLDLNRAALAEGQRRGVF